MVSDWKQVGVDFSDSNKAMANSTTSLSQAGNIFGNLSQQIEQQKQNDINNMFRLEELELQQQQNVRLQEAHDLDMLTDEETAMGLDMLNDLTSKYRTSDGGVNLQGLLTEFSQVSKEFATAGANQAVTDFINNISQHDFNVDKFKDEQGHRWATYDLDRQKFQYRQQQDAITNQLALGTLGQKNYENQINNTASIAAGSIVDIMHQHNVSREKAFDMLMADNIKQEHVKLFDRASEELDNPNSELVKSILRLDGSVKGNGHLGPIPMKDGSTATELSTHVSVDGNEMFIPLLVPTLSKKELEFITNGGDLHAKSAVLEGIQNKAIDYAMKRIQQGKSPFAGNNTKLFAEYTKEDKKALADRIAKSWATEIVNETYNDDVKAALFSDTRVNSASAKISGNAYEKNNKTMKSIDNGAVATKAINDTKQLLPGNLGFNIFGGDIHEEEIGAIAVGLAHNPELAKAKINYDSILGILTGFSEDGWVTDVQTPERLIADLKNINTAYDDPNRGNILLALALVKNKVTTKKAITFMKRHHPHFLVDNGKGDKPVSIEKAIEIFKQNQD